MSWGVFLRKLAMETSVVAIDRLLNDPDTPVKVTKAKVSRSTRSTQKSRSKGEKLPPDDTRI